MTENPGLSTQLQKWLPPGQSLSGAATGFENQGQFVAALHVAHNLNIPFDKLKAEMTGNGLPLGKAIQKLRPELDAKAAKDHVKLAERQADRDFDRTASEGGPDRVAKRVTRNEHLAEQLKPLLPAGTTLASAAAGFKNEGQFIATLHVANKLNVPFEELKDRVTAGQSLGAAIHDLKPAVSPQDIEEGVRSAEDQAKALR